MPGLARTLPETSLEGLIKYNAMALEPSGSGRRLILRHQFFLEITAFGRGRQHTLIRCVRLQPPSMVAASRRLVPQVSYTIISGFRHCGELSDGQMEVHRRLTVLTVPEFRH